MPSLRGNVLCWVSNQTLCWRGKYPSKSARNFGISSNTFQASSSGPALMLRSEPCYYWSINGIGGTNWAIAYGWIAFTASCTKNCSIMKHFLIVQITQHATTRGRPGYSTCEEHRGRLSYKAMQGLQLRWSINGDYNGYRDKNNAVIDHWEELKEGLHFRGMA